MSHLTEQIERLEDNLRQNKLAIRVAQQDEVRWKETFYQMLLISNETLDELLERLKDAEVELPLYGIPRGIKGFVGYCRGLLTKYKDVVKKAKRRL
jgi:hypothetical protein